MYKIIRIYIFMCTDRCVLWLEMCTCRYAHMLFLILSFHSFFVVCIQLHSTCIRADNGAQGHWEGHLQEDHGGWHSGICRERRWGPEYAMMRTSLQGAFLRVYLYIALFGKSRLWALIVPCMYCATRIWSVVCLLAFWFACCLLLWGHGCVCSYESHI